MFRLFCCACCALVCSVVSAQECDPRGGTDLHITADVTIDRPYAWFCDVYIHEGVTVSVVEGGHVTGFPRFEGASTFRMDGGYIDGVIDYDGMATGFVSGGESDWNLSFHNQSTPSSVSGGVLHGVAMTNGVVSGGSIEHLESSGLVTVTGGSIAQAETDRNGGQLLIQGGHFGEVYGAPLITGGSVDWLGGDVARVDGGHVGGLARGFVIWSGGKIDDAYFPDSIVIVRGSNLALSGLHLTGTLLDGLEVDQVFTSGTFLLSGEDLVDGDGDRDGLVGLEDLNGVRNNFGSGGYSQWDVNFDGLIDLADLNLVRNNFGATAANPVPEPSAITLLLIGAALLGNRCHRAKRTGVKCTGRRADPAR